MTVISNTGPLIAFLKAGRIDILHKLFGEIMIPPKVQEEILALRHASEVDEFQTSTWIQIQKLKSRPELLLQKELDDGEAEVIQLAVELDADLVILDEKKARRISQIYALPVKGTAGILVAAKRKKVIDSVEPILRKMRENGYFLSDRLIQATLVESNEGKG